MICQLAKSSIDEKSKHLVKRDLQGFLSMIKFNNQNLADVQEIKSLIYQENQYQRELFNRINQRFKGPPPLIKINSSHDDIQKETNLSKSKELEKVLEKVHNGIYVTGTTRSHRIFSQFDKNRDGYVDQHELYEVFKKKNLLQNQEFQLFYQYCDPNEKGYMDKQSFFEKMNVDMTSSNIHAENQNIYSPAGWPTQETYENYKNNLGTINQFIQNARDQVTDKSSILKPSFKPQVQPDWAVKSSFENFSIDQNSALYSSQFQRFNGNALQSLSRSAEQSQQLRNRRIQVQRINHQRIENRKQQIQKILQKKDESNLDHKLILQNAYQDAAHKDLKI